jgi:hypothetical protein
MLPQTSVCHGVLQTSNLSAMSVARLAACLSADAWSGSGQGPVLALR